MRNTRLLIIATLWTGCAYSQSVPVPEPAAQDVTAPAGTTPSADSKPDRQEDRRDRIFYSDETERVVPLSRKFAVNVFEDQKDILTLPFHMNRQAAIPLILVGVGAAALIATDHMSSRALPNSVDQVSFSKNVS